MLDQRVVRLDLAYDGTDFQGFNAQPGRRTVQSLLEESWRQITGEAVRVTPAGRTDTGVHALGQVVSVRTFCVMPADRLMRALNATLPMDVAVLAGSDQPPSFDARRSALRRAYRYTLWTDPVRNVRARRYSWHVPRRLDLLRMEQASSELLGEHDFRGFAARLARSSVTTTRRTVSLARWHRDDDGFLHFEVAANGFLRRMVRGLVGALVAVGHGRLDANEIRLRLQPGSEGAHIDHAPAHGLTLTHVDYE